MSGKIKFNTNTHKPLVLLSPLDWGLGHTTRCIPIIRELLRHGCDVVVACNHKQQSLLQQEFPHIRYVPLKGYNMQYGKSRRRTLGLIVLQVPKILTSVWQEHRWLKRFLKDNPVSAIISDNRFGLHAPTIPSIFITHQLLVKTSLGAFADRLTQISNYRMINRFDAVWVPDAANHNTMSGELSHPKHLPDIPIHYLGAISRLENCAGTNLQNDLVIVLSGPEPQRTIFENTLLKDLKNYKGKAVLVRGLPGNAGTVDPPGANITILNHARAAQLNELFCSAEMIISRSGYTTVMDLLKLGKKSILVPTQGQPEQEYLGKHLQKEQLAYCVFQHQFSLMEALQEAAQFPFKKMDFDMEQYQHVVQEFVAKLKNQ